jgi:hypothetical protein
MVAPFCRLAAGDWQRLRYCMQSLFDQPVDNVINMFDSKE